MEKYGERTKDIFEVGDIQVDKITVKNGKYINVDLKTTDKVDHPQHYTRENAIECIEEMILVFGEEAVATFCLLNCWKYRYRAGDKNGNEDIKKSDWYMNKYRELKKEKTKYAENPYQE